MSQEIKKEEIKPSTILKEVRKQEKTIEPKKQEKTRGTITLTVDRELIEELKKRAEKARLSMSRYVEIALRKALRLK